MLRIFAMALICLQLGTYRLDAQEVLDRSDLIAVFEAQKTTGTFVMLDLRADQLSVVNKQRAFERFIPASTFKFANSLIALETQAISGTSEVIPYGGKPQFVKSWEKDMALSEAFVVSNVPVFQEIARRVGLEAYPSWLEKLPYGNGLTGDDVERFWLAGPLKISAVEQVRFMAALAQGQLDLSQQSQKIVRDISRIETTQGAALHGKSGWTVAPDPDIGWFVGWVAQQGDVYAFALNIDMRGRVDAPLRERLARQFLSELGVY